ncbi:MAG: alpha/beta fold hydrolase [Syntrophomonadaceae bacterium]|nr:alpha/beta fold hydrolase [Syntrophomonadaceae bacterium]
MKEIKLLTGSAQEIGEQLQENVDRMIETTAKWAELLTFDPFPQTGMTPKETVWRKNKTKLYHYIPVNGTVSHKVPLLFIYALINKPFILDIAPGMSMIETLVNKGFDVYLLDWGEFAWEDRNLSIGDLVFDYIAHAVRKVCQFSGIDQLTILGYCMGGTIVSMYMSIFNTPKIKNFVTLAAPFDFETVGATSQFLKSKDFDVDYIVDVYKLIPKNLIDVAVKMLNPVNNYIGTYTRLWKMMDEGMSVYSWKILNKWINDNINFPGEAFRQWTKDIFQNNKIKKKEFSIRNQLIDLSKINCPVLTMAGKNDHIVLPGQAKAFLDMVSSTDKEYMEFNIGHGGLVFGSIAREDVYPSLAGWLETRSSLE